MRVLLADDESSVRSAFRLLLEQEAGVEVVGEVAEAGSLPEAVRTTAPDVLILDWDLPGFEPDDPACALQACCSQLKVIVTSGHPEVRALTLACGADGFISKIDPPERVLATLRALRSQQ